MKVGKGTLGDLAAALLASLALAGIAITAVACGEARGTDEASAFREVEPVAADEPVTYARLRAEVLQPFCLGCHKGFGSEERFARVIVPGDPEASLAVRLVENGRMPPSGPLPEAAVELLRSYVEGLAPEE